MGENENAHTNPLDYCDYKCSLISHFVRILPRNRTKAVTLMELLCVLAIIAIIMAIYLPTLARAFKHVKHVLFGFSN